VEEHKVGFSSLATCHLALVTPPYHSAAAVPRYGVVHRFARENVLFAKRRYGGVWVREFNWGRLTDSPVLDILKNPSYAGVYAFGRVR
jgi:hypothetical protein